MRDNEFIKEKIHLLHKGDEQQLKVIFSDSSRILVEAPAGYGKTTTMVSRIAYLYATGQIPNPKRMLGLTFSVNAALKIKRDVASKLPELLGSKDNPIVIGESVTVTNYHGFCKGILKKYGYLLCAFLKKDPNLFKAIGEYEIRNERDVYILLSNEEKDYLLHVEAGVKNSSVPSLEDIHKYNSIVQDKLLSQDVITHTSIIVMTLELFERYPSIREFYRNFYPLIVVDEFQDTNCIAWELLKNVIGEKSQLVFLGDSLQRIYGFIGALPDIMNLAKKDYQMEGITLARNYRFMNNPEMLKLDANIRSNAKTLLSNQLLEIALLQGIYGNSQEDEADGILDAVKKLQQKSPNSKIALLFRGRGKNVEIVLNALNRAQMTYFYGMFTDEDEKYIRFHIVCQDRFLEMFGNKKSISNFSLQKFADAIKKNYATDDSQIAQSLLVLLDALLLKVKTDYKELLPEEKYDLMLDIFENRQLKQAMEYVDSSTIISTVHGAKGLEWDYVIIADLESWIFPGFAICKECDNRYIRGGAKCDLPNTYNQTFINEMVDELSVFYVAITRARKQVYVSASGKRYNNSGDVKDSRYSCFANLPGIKLVQAEFE